MPQLKITVVKRVVNEDLRRTYVRGASDAKEGELKPCSRFEDGQTFVGEAGLWPEGFGCALAWGDVRRQLTVIGGVGSLPDYAKPETAHACCSDGLAHERVPAFEEVWPDWTPPDVACDVCRSGLSG